MLENGASVKRMGHRHCVGEPDKVGFFIGMLWMR